MPTAAKILKKSEKEFNYNLKGYILFWVGQLVSLLGSSIVQFVIIWWITIETKSGFFLAISSFLGFGPGLILTPIFGVFVDRWSRKKILIMTDFFQVLITILLIYLFLANIADIWSILVIVTIRGLLQAFQRPVVQAIIPIMVPRENLSRINGLDYLFNGVIRLIGAPTGAILLSFWDITNILWLDAFTFMIALIPTSLITIPSVLSDSKNKNEVRKFRDDLTEGFIFIKNKHGLFSLLIVFTAANFFLRPIYVLLPLFVTEIHFGDASELALMLVAVQAGLITGSAVMSTFKGFSNKATGVAVGIFLMYFGMFILSVAPPGMFWILAFGMFIMGFNLPVANVSSQTIWQNVIPPEKLGRVYSVRRSVAQISSPAATLATGIIVEAIGILPIYWV
ncbi:MAG: MFS transporter, partial [Candidatus Hodarchaeota archaeon]